MDGKAEGRWIGTSPCDNERTIALKTNALRAYEGKSLELIPPGPRSRIGTTLSDLQAVVTGVVSSLPRYVPSFLSRIGFSIPTARRFSSNVANSRSRAFRYSIFMQESVPTSMCTR